VEAEKGNGKENKSRLMQAVMEEVAHAGRRLQLRLKS
jgi:hypothetical protein